MCVSRPSPHTHTHTPIWSKAACQMPSESRSSLTCWLRNGASAHISGSRTRRGENHAEVRGGLGSQTAKGFFPTARTVHSPLLAVLRDPWHVRKPPFCPEGGGNGNKTYTLTLDPHGPTQPRHRQRRVYISGTRLCERCR